MFFLLVSLYSISSLAETGKVVYQQDFQSGNSDILLPVAPAPGVPNGTAVVTTEGTNKFLKFTTTTGADENGYFDAYFGPVVKDFDLELKLRPDLIKNPDYNWGKVYFRSPIHYENESYIFDFWSWRACMDVKSAINNKKESNKIVENQNMIFDNGTWYDIKISCRGSNISSYVNGVKVGEFQDTTFTQGTFGFCSWGVNFSVDDIKITSYDPDTSSSVVSNTSTSTVVSSKPSLSKVASISSQQSSADASSSIISQVSSEESNPSNESSSKIVVVNNSNNSNNNVGLIIIIILAILIIGGGITTFIMIRRKATL